MSSEQNFINNILTGARNGYSMYGVYTSVTLAQAIIESGWGSSKVSQNDNNLFGIKFDGNHDPSLSISQGSAATDGGYFTRYSSWSDSVQDHGYFLRHNSNYAAAFSAKDPLTQLRAIANGNYGGADTEGYYNTIAGCLKMYDLTQYDTGTYTGTVSSGTGSTNTGIDSLSIPVTNYSVIGGSQQSNGVLYGRKYRVLVVDNNKGTALDVSQLRCKFNIQKTMMMQANYSTITIYNLSANTENSLITEGNRIVVEAGYEGEQYGVIFDGTVIQPIRDKQDGVDYLLTLNCLDADGFLNGGVVNFSLLKGQTHRDVVNNLVSKAKVSTFAGNLSKDLDNVQLLRGKVCFGLAKDIMSQIAKTQGGTFYMEDGAVNIIKMTDLPTDEIIELSPSSGLIGVPAQTEYGVSGKCLLNPRVKVNSLIHIDNSLIHDMQAQIKQVIRSLDNSGIYRVIQVNYNCDTRGDEWFSEFQTVSQAGMMPSMMNNSTGNPF